MSSLSMLDYVVSPQASPPLSAPLLSQEWVFLKNELQRQNELPVILPSQHSFGVLRMLWRVVELVLAAAPPLGPRMLRLADVCGGIQRRWNERFFQAKQLRVFPVPLRKLVRSPGREKLKLGDAIVSSTAAEPVS